jgi:hypothetical protein
MQSDDDRRDDAGGAVERMLEEMSYQTDMLGRVLAEMKRANCQLEQVARQTCEAQNELHRQTALQGCLLKLLAYQVEVARAGNPGLAQLLDCKYGFDRCFELGECQGGPPPCKHVPCPDGYRLESGSGDSKTGKVPSRRVKDAPYPPVRREDNQPASRTRARSGKADRPFAASCVAARARSCKAGSGTRVEPASTPV